MKTIDVYFMPHPPLAVKEIGQGKERGIQATVDGMIEIAKTIQHNRPDTIIYISPHGNSFSNGIALLYDPIVKGDFGPFGYPGIGAQKSINMGLTSDISDALSGADITNVLLDHNTANRYKVQTSIDHGVLVPMHYIDKYYDDYQLVHITPSYQDLSLHYRLGTVLKDVIDGCGEKVAVVCSGDLSHALKEEGPYNFHPYGAVFDELVSRAIKTKDPSILVELDKNCEKDAAQCGLRSFIIGFGMMDGHDYESRVLSYEGPFGVGYLTGYLKNDFTSLAPSYLKQMASSKQKAYEALCQKEDDYIKPARLTINTYVKEHRRPSESQIMDLLSDEHQNTLRNERAGAFVSIHKNGQLRGCIGTTEATSDSLLDEIIHCAISACSSDPRFNPVDPSELIDLEIKVDRLYPYEPVIDIYELDEQRYGVIVEKGSKRGLLLPRIEGVNSVEEQIEIAKRKAGIHSDDYQLYRFEVERHEVKKEVPWS